METINLGKRPLVRRRGRGGHQFRSTATGKVGKTATYPRFPLAENHTGEIIDLIHERGREAPLSKVRFEDGTVSFIPAVLGTKVGESLEFGLKSKIEKGNVISVQNIPDGTIVCNDGVTIKLPSGKFATLNPKNRAMIGTLSGGGATERHFMSAGNKWRSFKAKGKKYPIVRGVAQAAYVHPHGGGRHQHVGQSSTVSRDAPPGAKVGSIAARKTGRARIKERK
jgi:large subunit ribosomal protein L2